MSTMRNWRGSRGDMEWATNSGVTFPEQENRLRLDLYMKVSDAPFNYYIVMRDDSSVVQGFYDITCEVVENGILTLTGRDSDNHKLKVHFPLDFVKHWCEIGPGEKVSRDSQS